MRRIAATLVLLATAAAPASAAGDTKPDALTARETSEGWLLLFDGESSFGWSIDGESTVTDGWLTLGGTKATTVRTTTFFPSFEASAEYQVSGVAANLHI